MKQIITFFFLAFCLIISIPTQAQDKDDLLEILEILLDLDEVQGLYQHQLSQGATLVFQKPDRRAMGRNPNDRLQNLLFDLRDDDFSFFSRPVRIMKEETAKDFDISPRSLTSIGLQMGATQTRIILNCYLWESQEMYRGQFSFFRESEDDDWELNSKNSDTQISR